MFVSPSFQSVCKNNSVKERIYFSRAMWLTEYLKGAARFSTLKSCCGAYTGTEMPDAAE